MGRTDQQFWTKLAQPISLIPNKLSIGLLNDADPHSTAMRSTWTCPTFKLERVAYRMLFVPMQKYWCTRLPLVLFHPYF